MNYQVVTEKNAWIINFMGGFKNPSEMNDDLDGLEEQRAEFLRMCSVLSLRAHIW